LKATDIGRELLYPATNSSVLIAFVSFFLLLEFAAFGGLLGLFLAVLILPALMRYLMLLLEVRTTGSDPGPPGIELFMWFESLWSLFPIVHVLLLIYSTYIIGGLFGAFAVLAIDLLLVALMPASLIVLAMTRSPAEALRPGAVFGLMQRCGSSYWIAPAFIIVATFTMWWLSTLPVIDFLLELVGFYLLFASFALIGGLLRPFGLNREIAIPACREATADVSAKRLEHERGKVLNHAYGFISRGNRTGGLAHIRQWLHEDPDPDTAWPWFYDQMLRWEINDAALLFAQQYLHRLLHNGQFLAANKLMLRCREVDAAFRPLTGDAALALKAAEHFHNDDLIRFLELR